MSGNHAQCGANCLKSQPALRRPSPTLDEALRDLSTYQWIRGLTWESAWIEFQLKSDEANGVRQPLRVMVDMGASFQERSISSVASSRESSSSLTKNAGDPSY